MNNFYASIAIIKNSYNIKLSFTGFGALDGTNCTVRSPVTGVNVNISCFTTFTTFIYQILSF